MESLALYDKIWNTTSLYILFPIYKIPTLHRVDEIHDAVYSQLQD